MAKQPTKGDKKVAYLGIGLTVIFEGDDGAWHPQTFGIGYTNIPRRAVVRFQSEMLKLAPRLMRVLSPILKLGVKLGQENVAEPVAK